MGTIIGGHISLESIMTSRSRKILHIYFDKLRLETVKRSDFHFPEKKQYERITEFASKYSVPISYLTDSEFAELTGGESFGGIAAEVGERTYSDFRTVISENKNGYFVLLDGIEDPFNFGYVLRTLYTAGVDGVFLPERNFLSAASTVIRSSAGTSELLNIASYNDVDELFAFLKENGIFIVATAKTNESTDIFAASFKRPLCVVIGGEKRGINKTVSKYADKTVSIVYPRDTGISLSASSAAAIIAYQVANRLDSPPRKPNYSNRGAGRRPR